jgi:hypothetical protein
MSKTISVNVAPGLSVLQITLVLLKAFAVIDWSWFLVFFPLWLPLVLVMGIIFAVFFSCVIAAILK